jgi:hypothetical protein
MSYTDKELESWCWHGSLIDLRGQYTNIYNGTERIATQVDGKYIPLITSAPQLLKQLRHWARWYRDNYKKGDLIWEGEDWGEATLQVLLDLGDE